MSWTIDNPPRPSKNWTHEQKRKCVKVANSVLQKTNDESKAIFACIRAAGKSTKVKNHNENYILNYINNLLQN